SVEEASSVEETSSEADASSAEGDASSEGEGGEESEQPVDISEAKNSLANYDNAQVTFKADTDVTNLIGDMQECFSSIKEDVESVITVRTLRVRTLMLKSSIADGAREARSTE
ncbi:MAG: hypothetical protein IKR76_10110, partial [Ruminococcus sp.]|nr:hypothetical protein [Ruminococcus sp.]